MLSAVDYASSNDPFCAKQPLPEREVLTDAVEKLVKISGVPSAGVRLTRD